MLQVEFPITRIFCFCTHVHVDNNFYEIRKKKTRNRFINYKGYFIYVQRALVRGHLVMCFCHFTINNDDKSFKSKNGTDK